MSRPRPLALCLGLCLGLALACGKGKEDEPRRATDFGIDPPTRTGTSTPPTSTVEPPFELQVDAFWMRDVQKPGVIAWYVTGLDEPVPTVGDAWADEPLRSAVTRLQPPDPMPAEAGEVVVGTRGSAVLIAVYDDLDGTGSHTPGDPFVAVAGPVPFLGEDGEWQVLDWVTWGYGGLGAGPERRPVPDRLVLAPLEVRLEAEVLVANGYGSGGMTASGLASYTDPVIWEAPMPALGQPGGGPITGEPPPELLGPDGMLAPSGWAGLVAYDDVDLDGHFDPVVDDVVGAVCRSNVPDVPAIQWLPPADDPATLWTSVYQGFWWWGWRTVQVTDNGAVPSSPGLHVGWIQDPATAPCTTGWLD